MPAALVQRRIPARVCNSYCKFCVERNQWEKVLHHYYMQASRLRGRFSLDEYLARGKFPINYPRYTDSTGTKIIVNPVLRYENLDAELTEVFSQLNVPFDRTLRILAKSECRTGRTPCQLVFNEEQSKIISEVFAREIALHGYRFESGLNRIGAP